MGKHADKLVGKKVIVVGGSSGIGFGVAEALLDVGAIVTIVSSSSDKVAHAVKRLNSPNVKGLVGNVLEEAAFVEVLRSLAPVDHVVFSGVDKIIRGKLADVDLNDAKSLFGVKFWGAIIIGKAVSKYDIIKSGGSLTLTSGLAGIKPGKGASVGGALNGGLLTLNLGLAGDLAEKKIRVNTVVPGLVKTELWDKLGKNAEQQKEEFENAAKRLPVGFVATPVEIAEAYLYLIRADYATGTLVQIGKWRGWLVNTYSSDLEVFKIFKHRLAPKTSRSLVHEK